ncbi:hypothetical protein BD626DRAFT_578729 [Schizophyllum amplum]|uniref:Uncharacterized protein n=1 Tax=Schizophyllum amplum TaxID=97359 RepID=A0A550BRT7_9AGAR|nr:hypothetical protein BD626DRAFT_578729 [Auriculariopsis ampla]
MRDPERRRASKRAYYERHKQELQVIARERYARQQPVSSTSNTPSHRARMRTGRDAERRQASKQTYYTRHKDALRQKARERMSRQRASQDASAQLKRRLACMSYRYRYHELLNNKRLNLYRKRWMKTHGVARFLNDFRGRVQLPHGMLLEHWDADTLESVLRGST